MKIETLRSGNSCSKKQKQRLSLKDEIKAEMLMQNTEEMTAGKYIVLWTSVLSQRFDSTTFKKEHADMYKLYTKQTSSRRFSIA